MNVGVMARVGSSEDVVAMLRGSIGVLEAAASAAGIENIGSFSVQDARQHLTGFRTFPKVKGKSVAKEAVMKAVKTLGIDVQGHDQADAACGWLYCSALANPRLAHLDTPLFGRR